jgi:amylosucrase
MPMIRRTRTTAAGCIGRSMDWKRAAAAEAGEGVAGRILAGVRHVLARRAATPELHAGYPTEIADTHRPELFAFVRQAPTGALVCVFNFTEFWTTLRADWAYGQGAARMHDALSDAEVALDGGSIRLPPYARIWLR